MNNTLLDPPARVRPTSTKLYTVADLAVLPDELPSGPVKYELDDGVIVSMAPPGHMHSRKQGKVISILSRDAEERGLGEYLGEVAIILRRNPDRVVGPDAAFLTTDQLPPKCSKEGYLETIPKLVVEVKSKNDSWPEVESKVAEYLTAGVELVWVVDLKASVLHSYEPNQALRVLAGAELVTAPFLPGFRVAAEEFFN